MPRGGNRPVRLRDVQPGHCDLREGASLAAISREAGLHKDLLSRHLGRVDPGVADAARRLSPDRRDAAWWPALREHGFPYVPGYLAERHMARHWTVNAIAAEADVSHHASSPHCGGTAWPASRTPRDGTPPGSARPTSPRGWATPASPTTSVCAGARAGPGRRWLPSPVSRRPGCGGRRRQQRGLAGPSSQRHEGSRPGRGFRATGCSHDGHRRLDAASNPAVRPAGNVRVRAALDGPAGAGHGGAAGRHRGRDG